MDIKHTTAVSHEKLDGITILRYAHAFEGGGGVEQHLRDLNRQLSVRNNIKTIQMQLTLNASGTHAVEERFGSSLLIKIPLLVEKRILADSSEKKQFAKVKQASIDLVLHNPRLNAFAVNHLLHWRKVPRRQGEPKNAGAKATEIIRKFKVDLVVLHTSGGADASEIIHAAKSSCVPIAIVHHFSNERLGGISLRQQIAQVDAVAGASLVGVPRYLKKHFWNLSDAVDTEFYRRENARPLSRKVNGPVLYAPARFTPNKGQSDVLEIASILKQRGLELDIIFAGRVDCQEFEACLRDAAINKGLADRVHFLGPLSLDEYRDWYSVALVTVMPTRHDEGMPRTLIDSQAMGVPPIVYDAGGTREGIRDRETGFLVRAGDVKEMALAVETLARNPMLRHRMAVAGRTFVEENFSMAAFAQRHEELYLYVLQHHNG